jgi:hypothetical protein
MNRFDHVESYRDDINAGRAIAIIWQIGDIQGEASDRYDVELTEEQASEILLDIKRRHDCEIGINWDVIREYIGWYLGVFAKYDTDITWKDGEEIS